MSADTTQLVARVIRQAIGLGQSQDQDIAFSFWVEGIDAGALLVTQFAVEESIFGLAHIEVRLVSKYQDIDLDALIDQPASLSVHHKYLDTIRHFSGIVVEAERGDSGHHRTSYHLVLMPSLSRLDHGSDCRIFQGQTVPEIVDEVLKEHGITNVHWQISEEHQPREFLVCYRETHLAFIERILAEEGIFYYFQHGEEGKCELVLTDNPDDLPDCPGQAVLEYNSLAGGVHYGVYCSSIDRSRKLRSTGYRQRDYSFKNPPYHQEHLEEDARGEGEKGDYELYDYPGRYKRDGAGRPFTRNKLEAVRVGSDLVHGIANTPLLLAGHGFTLMSHPDMKLNRKWRLLTLRHEGVQPQAMHEDAQTKALNRPTLFAPPVKGADLVGSSYGIVRSGSMMKRASILDRDHVKGEGDSCRYSCAFTAQDATQPYRPPQLQKPLVDGPQIAHVVGPEGEEIHTDEYSRVKVHFPWDRHKDPKAEDSSCWIRVASNWAGSKWGHIAIPRIGQEVIVEFLEGDPDQPIITGRTYHAVNQPPYLLPKNKTRMTIQSKTHKGDGFNELRFEDEKDEEEVFLHAEKYLNAKVKDNETWEIGGNRHKRVDGSQSESIGGAKDIEVSGVHREVISGEMSLKVDSSRREEIAGNDMLIVRKNKSELIKGNWTRKVERSVRVESKAHQHYTAPGTIFVDAGDELVLRAGSVISLNVGGNFIRIDDSGIIVEGTVVNINTGQGSPAKGKDVPMVRISNADEYKGPHAKRYKRSYEK